METCVAMDHPPHKWLSFDELKKGLLEDSLFILDVRTSEERLNPGRIPGTCHLDCECLFYNRFKKF